eukprot:5624058-Pyramimonas_sp.AAC.1
MRGAEGVSQRASCVVQLESTVKSIQQTLTELSHDRDRDRVDPGVPSGHKLRVRSPGSSRSTSTGSASAWAPSSRAGTHQERACRLVVLGFPRPMMASTLRRAAEQI